VTSAVRGTKPIVVAVLGVLALVSGCAGQIPRPWIAHLPLAVLSRKSI
jgi:hypothetical protein